jgi:hypothetical protein
MTLAQKVAAVHRLWQLVYELNVSLFEQVATLQRENALLRASLAKAQPRKWR